MKNKLSHCTCSEENIEEHGCPHAIEIENDNEFTCTCCDFCVKECEMDV